MDVLKGIEFTVEVKGLDEYARCLLNFMNIKSSRDAVVEVATVEGTDIIKVVGLKEFESSLLSVASDYGRVIGGTDDINIFMLEDEDAEKIGGRKIDKLYDADESVFVTGKFSNY